MSRSTPHIERQSLLGLPAELRLMIYTWLFRSLVVEVERGPERSYYTSWDIIDTAREGTISHGLSPSPGIPREVAALRSVCKQINAEIDDSWHSLVTYRFPSTVAFMDVLSQWPFEKVQSLRSVHVVDTPMAVDGSSGFAITHNFNEALAWFPGLQLDLLTVENIWLLASGEPIGGQCLMATGGTLKRLLTTNGWRRVEYLSGVLGLSPTQMKQLDTVVENYKVEQQEPDFQYHLGHIRPLVHSRENLLDRSEGPEDVEETYKHVKQWYDEHPEERRPSHESDYLEEVTRKSIVMWAERGHKANYAQNGESLSANLEDLKDEGNWQDIRQTDDFIVDDGVDNPVSHL